MAAAYDNYDYPSYWQGREYEHDSEVVAMKSFLSRIPKIKKILEIGAGYGRLTPLYFFRADKIIISDPSARLLKAARKNFESKKVRFLQLKAENLPGKLKGKTIDLIIFVRVAHHIEDLEKVIGITKRLLKKNGYLVLEFANKMHAKARMVNFFHGNFTFPFNTETLDRRSNKSIEDKTIPFMNYHPELIKKALLHNGYEIVETRSVSNFRNSFLKKALPKEVLIFVEKHTQKLFSLLNLGPSIFILARKVSDNNYPKVFIFLILSQPYFFNNLTIL